MALVEIKGISFTIVNVSQLSGKTNKDCNSSHEVEIYLKFKGTRRNSGQLSAQSSIYDLPSNSMRQESYCE